MRYTILTLVFTCMTAPSFTQSNKSNAPSNEKAQKTYKQALQYLDKHRTAEALDSFKKANKQDGGHCLTCQENIIKYALQLRDWKTAETAAQEVVAEAADNHDIALAHYEFGVVLLREAIVREKKELFSRAHAELTAALTAFANFPAALFADGQALAHLQEDDQAKRRFEQFVKLNPANDLDRQRALRFIARPELARARMAPAFALTTTQGQRIALDELTGKVVLLDFWATWCAPCREALPHIRQIAKKFRDQPLVVLSVSLDDDEQKWKDFVSKNQMTWPQYRDGGFDGPIATLFGVEAIPHTFAIDSDGVLQDERIGDSSIEGRLKKLLARAQEIQISNKSQ